jgi:hypothetical protein
LLGAPVAPRVVKGRMDSSQEGKNEPAPEAERPAIGLAEFLESHPPGSGTTVASVVRSKAGQKPDFVRPEIRLHCASSKCGGTRTFVCREDSGYASIDTKWAERFLTYVCRNCGETERIFALRARARASGRAEVYKVGEFPPFGPPMPARVISLIGPERDLFLKGRRAENQGLGVGAFAYYRRVIESQWKRLVEEIIRVAERVGASTKMIQTLRDALKETQFNKAVEGIREGIPDVLKISGQNPLTLLYRALSEGLHDESDEYCLELASSVRIVLTELAERIGQALKDEKELQDAVNRLVARKPSKKDKGGGQE